jgi:hypothetical protein
LHLHSGQEAIEPLVLQVFKGAGFLSRLGVDHVPSGAICLGYFAIHC